MKVLIIGSGGREHALGWKIAQSSKVTEVIYSPGNAGTEKEQKSRNLSLDGSKKENFEAIADVILSENIDLTIVGPEQPLSEGIVDVLNIRGARKVFGPSQEASFLESDKFYSYDLMKDLNIPQANSIKCTSKEEAIVALDKIINEFGVVLKARGLAAGKGVAVCDNKEEALAVLEEHEKHFGSDLLVAERLVGEEFSIFGISDGNQILPIELSFQDHKRVFDNDKGPNTGGMGAYGPAPIASKKIVQEVCEKVMNPIIREMKNKGTEYKGFLYAGMIMTASGPKVIEFNVRFGDPECQPAMMMLKSDLYEVLTMAMNGKLNEIKMELNSGVACCVVLASQGYPGNYRKGLEIKGLENRAENVKIFHAGTKEEDGKIVTSGGRVLGVTACSENIKEATALAYSVIEKISVPGGFHYRKDIAKKAL